MNFLSKIMNFPPIGDIDSKLMFYLNQKHLLSDVYRFTFHSRHGWAFYDKICDICASKQRKIQKREKMSQKTKSPSFLGVSKIQKHRKLRIFNAQLSIFVDFQNSEKWWRLVFFVTNPILSKSENFMWKSRINLILMS